MGRPRLIGGIAALALLLGGLGVFVLNRRSESVITQPVQTATAPTPYVLTPPSASAQLKTTLVEEGHSPAQLAGPNSAATAPALPGPGSATGTAAAAGDAGKSGARFLGNARPFSANSPWNTLTPAATKWYDHPLLHRISSGQQRMYWLGRGVAIYYARSTDPVWTLKLPQEKGWPACNRPFQPAKTVKIRAPKNISVAHVEGGDAIINLVDGTHYYELWLTKIDPAARTITGTAWSEGDIVSGTGIGNAKTRAGMRAANFSWAAGAITGHDVSKGKIDHALALLLPRDMLNGVGNPVAPFIPPATCADNGGANGPIKSGSKVGIPRGIAKPAGLSSMGSMIFDALQKYGAYVGDFVGGQWPFFTAEANTIKQSQIDPFFAFWGPTGKADYQQIEGLLRVANYQP